MRAKKPATRSSRSVRYLLSADQKLQRLSLKKMSVPGKKAKLASRSPRSARPASARPAEQGEKQAALAAHESAHAAWLSGRRATIAGVICVVGAAALIGMRQPSPPADAVAETQPASLMAPEPVSRPSEEARVHPPTRPEPRKVVPKSADTTPAAAPRTLHAASASVQPVESRPAAPAPVAAKPVVASPAPLPPEPAPKPVVDDASAPVTVTGCLQVDDDAFWLKDPSGSDAPTQRSWKSGFLRKRPAPIELVGSAGALKLSSYVGQRVAATGTLVNRELHPRSVRRVSPSCD